MATFTTNTYNDVLAIAKTFGVAALEYAVKNSTVDIAFPALVRDCNRWAARNVIELTSVNDGNIEYSVDASFTAERVNDEYITNLNDIIITRRGFGAYTKTISQAVNDKDINLDSLDFIISSVRERNAARIILGM